MPTSRMFPNTVTITTRSWSNVRGVRTPTTTTTSRPASVQPMRAARREAHGMSAGATGYTVYFAAVPAVRVDDAIGWSGKTLAVLGPARDEAGRGEIWSVDCIEVA